MHLNMSKQQTETHSEILGSCPECGYDSSLQENGKYSVYHDECYLYALGKNFIIPQTKQVNIILKNPKKK